MSTNNKISNLINSQVPFFVRNDHQTFVSFLEAYYEYLEQSNTTLQFGKTTERAKNFLNYIDIDKTLDEFAEKLYNRFLYLNINSAADKKFILKHVQDFYRAKGSEKAYRFLMRALYGEEMQFYYPKVDVLRASDGKWYIQKSLRVTDVRIANTSNSNLTGLEKFTSTKVTGQSSDAFGIVERVERFSEQGTQVDELVLSGIKGVFENGEQVRATFTDEFDNTVKTITANVRGGAIESIIITNPGSAYKVGDHVYVTGDGAGACVVVGRVSTGNVSGISVLSGGAGYQNGNFLLITGGGGSGANAQVDAVNLDGLVHPTSYDIVSSLISYEAETPINNTVYSNLNSAIINPATSNTIANVVISFIYGNTGPARLISVNSPGNDYGSNPDISILANTRILELGILGRLKVISSGTAYSNNDFIIFENVPGGYGFGAKANLIVNGTGSIIRTEWAPVQGQIIGGSGYDENFLPTANIQRGAPPASNLTIATAANEGPLTVSNLTFNTATSWATTNTITLNHAAGNSNVAFGNGYILNVRNSNVSVISYNPSSNTISVSPNVSSNLVANTLLIYSKQLTTNTIILSGDAKTSNIAFANGYTLNVRGSNVSVVSYNPDSNTINVSPSVSSNIIANNMLVYTFGTNGIVEVVSLLGGGAVMQAANSTIGAILRLDILNKGSNYLTADLDFTANGDGTATGTAVVSGGVITYPGRYLNDDGHISAYNFLQDRDYYQNHSYVLRLKRSIDDYRQIVKDFLHPAGMKLWGQYELESNYHDYEPNTVQSFDSTEVVFKNGTYNSVNGNVTIRLTSHTQSIGSNVFIEFTSGDVSSNADNVGKISNGAFRVVNVINADAFGVVHYSSQANTSGNAYVGVVVT